MLVGFSGQTDSQIRIFVRGMKTRTVRITLTLRLIRSLSSYETKRTGSLGLRLT